VALAGALIVAGPAFAAESPSGSITSPADGSDQWTAFTDGTTVVLIEWHATCVLDDPTVPWYIVVVIRNSSGATVGTTGTEFAPSGSSTYDGDQGFVLSVPEGKQSETFDAALEVHCGKNIDTNGGSSFTVCRAPTATSDAERNAIKSHEGLRLHTYDDDGAAKGKRNCTIGWGHLIHTGACQCTDPSEACKNKAEKPFYKGITKARAEKLFDADLAAREAFIQRVVAAKPGGLALNRCQFDALIDFYFNVGSGHYVKKGKKRVFQEYTWVRDLRDGDYALIPDEMRKFHSTKALAARHDADASAFDGDCSC
jgi:GH24 family phage-related lysozyme (muramidase)